MMAHYSKQKRFSRNGAPPQAAFLNFGREPRRNAESADLRKKKSYRNDWMHGEK